MPFNPHSLLASPAPRNTGLGERKRERKGNKSKSGEKGNKEGRLEQDKKIVIEKGKGKGR